MSEKFMCGQIWQRQWPDCRRFLLAYVNSHHNEDNSWTSLFAMMVVGNGHATDPTLNAVGFQHREDGSYLFDMEQLEEWFFQKSSAPDNPEDASKLCDLKCEFVPKHCNPYCYELKNKEER